MRGTKIHVYSVYNVVYIMYSCSIVFYIISEYNSILSSYTEVFWSILILWGFRQMQKN